VSLLPVSQGFLLTWLSVSQGYLQVPASAIQGCYWGHCVRNLVKPGESRSQWCHRFKGVTESRVPSVGESLHQGYHGVRGVIMTRVSPLQDVITSTITKSGISLCHGHQWIRFVCEAGLPMSEGYLRVKDVCEWGMSREGVSEGCLWVKEVCKRGVSLSQGVYELAVYLWVRMFES
jgi:hypothetical protein